MGTILAKNIRGMSLWSKIGVIFLLLTGILVYQGVFRPQFLNSATNTYYFTLDTVAVNLGADGSTTTTQTLGGKISMKPGVYATSRRVTAAANTTTQTMLNAYGPAYTANKTVTSPSVSIGVRNALAGTGAINWQAKVYDYNPAGTANNGTLLWTSSLVEAHPTVQTPLNLPFSDKSAKMVASGHRLKVVITAQMANSSTSQARLYWGNTTNYSFLSVSEANYVANSVTVDNLADANAGALTAVLNSETNIAMLQFDMYSNAASPSWTSGKLDKIGTNSDSGAQVQFSIWKDNGDGAFDSSTDTKIGGPYSFSSATGQAYTLTTAQTLTTSPQRYFVVYDLAGATTGTTVGARIADSSYFTVSGAAGGVTNVTATSSSLPSISSGGSTVTKNYAADWDTGHTLTLSTVPTSVSTNSTCITRTTSTASSLIGYLNYPSHSCTSVSGQFYTANAANSSFVKLYMSKSSGYSSILTTLTGVSFTHRISVPAAGGTFTYTLFYVDPTSGTQVNATTPAKYTVAAGTAATSQIITVSLGGQTFSNVPMGAHLGIQIGVSAASMGIGLGSSVAAQLTVQESAAANNGVDVGDGSTIANSSVNASATDVPVDSFTLSSSQAQNVTSVTILGNAMFNSTNIKNVKIYLDNGTKPGVLDSGDTLIGTAAGSSISGNSVAVTLSTPQAMSLVAKRYIVAYDIADSPNVNIVLTGLVSDLAASVGAIGNNTDANGASVTILPSTYLSDVAESGTPAYVKPGGAATVVDGFSLKINGGVQDTIRDLTVTLATTSAIASTQYSHISDYIAKVEIVNATGTVVYGSQTAPLSGDDWQIPITTTAMYATTTPTSYYVRITPKANQTVTYDVAAQITALAHSKTTYGLSVNDATSSTVIIDGQAPPNPGSFSATTDTGNAGGSINLNWLAATEPSTPGSGLAGSGLQKYILVRGAANSPAPTSCSSGTAITLSSPTATSYTDSGLNSAMSYGYRICSVDNVGNTSLGAKVAAVSSTPTACNKAPALFINPMSQFVKVGGQVRLRVAYTNNDTGNCSPVPFTLSTSGADTTNFTVAFDSYTGTLKSNSGSKATYLTVAAKSTAPQNISNTFHVSVNGGGAYTATCPDPVTITVNNSGSMIHSSQQLGTIKYGSWGVGYNCNTCHAPVGTNIKQVKSAIVTPIGSRPVVFTTTSAAQSVTTGVFGNDLRVGTSSTNVCEVCHHNTRYHRYSANTTVKSHNNSRDCMVCHQHNNGFKSTGAAGCSDCHGNPPTSIATMASPPTYALKPYTASYAGKHAIHNNRGITCYACHNSANHARDIANNTPDSLINMQFKVDGTTLPGFAGSVTTGTFNAGNVGNGYSWSPGSGTTLFNQANNVSCNVYCHNINYNNAGYEVNSNGYNNIPSWVGDNQVACGSCHAARGDDTYFNSNPNIALGSHQKHASTMPGNNAIPCGKCHGFRNYSTTKAHLNGNVEWDLSAISGTATYKAQNAGSTGNVAPSASYGSCANLYCHSNSQNNQTTVGASTVVGTRFGNPTWGSSTTCGSCHDYPNTTGGHPQHVGDPAVSQVSFDCRVCHNSGGDANSFNHANGQINFQFAGLGQNTHYSYSSVKTPGSGPYGTCYNSNCHGRSTKTWGPSTGLALCEKCHGSASTAGFYNTLGPGSTISNTDSHVGAHFRHLTSLSANSPAPANVKYSASFDCSACHAKPDSPYTPGHIDQGRVNNGLSTTLTFGALAHNSYTSAAHDPSYNSATGQCSNVWCHGSGMNSNEGTGPYQSVGPAGQTGPLGQLYDGGTLGTPLVPTWNQPFITGNAGASGPASSSGGDCTKCHSYPPAAPLPGYRHYGYTVGPDCTKCHTHLNTTATGFTDPSKHVNGQVDSCYNCHGRPPVDMTTLANPPINALNPGMIGAHNKHADNPAIGDNCSVCHNGFVATSMQTGNMLLGFNVFGGKMQSGTFYGYSTLTGEVWKSGSAGTTIRRTENSNNVNKCANVYCHGGGTVAPSSQVVPAIGGGSKTTPFWENGAVEASCGNCHGTTYANYSSRGSHGRHTGSTSNRPGISCEKCHGPHNDNSHVNGSVKWSFYSTVKRMNATAGYGTTGYKPSGASFFNASGSTGNLAPSSAYGTCNVYCHSDARGTFANPVWGSGSLGSPTCGACHKNMATDATAPGAHYVHANILGYACSTCHNGAGSGTANHVNGTIELSFSGTATGTTYSKASPITPNVAYGTCSNIPCHGGGTATWASGTGVVPCLGCHSNSINNRAAIGAQFSGQSHHIQGATIDGTKCYLCHWEANSDGSINYTYHQAGTSNAAVTLVINATTSRPTTATHGTTFSNYTAVSANATRQRAQINKINNTCLSCHNLANAAWTPFGDGKVPQQYAWDGKSINERYSQAGTTNWSSYTDAASTNVATKSTQTKAFSAHGRADLNKRGWDTSETWPDTSGNNATTSIVRCYDCHNSHGTSATGVMSSYSSATGRFKGGILKSTTAGKGGYSVNYIPTAGGSAAVPNKNAYNPGAALCFDCHNNSAATTTPWGYNATFGATQAIYGYNDTANFGNGTFGTVTRFGTTYKGYSAAGKNMRSNKGGHFGASSALTTTITQRAFDVTPQAGMTAIKGLCTPCHDPHGVSPTLTQANAVPLLKGTWATSFYKEDAAPANTNEARGGTTKSGEQAVKNVGSTPGYHIDQNTLGTMANGKPSQLQDYPALSGANTLQTIADTNFAGLCTGCHAKAQLVYPNTTSASTGNWKKMRRVHMSVKGWASTAGSGGNKSNAIHAYTCSKCHTPHNYRLPRLLVTNCLDAKHRGRGASGGNPTAQSGTGTSGAGQGRFPAGGGGSNDLNSAINPGPWFFGTGQAGKPAAAIVTCHDDAQAGGTTYSLGAEQWNNKTPW